MLGPDDKNQALPVGGDVVRTKYADIPDWTVQTHEWPRHPYFYRCVLESDWNR